MKCLSSGVFWHCLVRLRIHIYFEYSNSRTVSYRCSHICSKLLVAALSVIKIRPNQNAVSLSKMWYIDKIVCSWRKAWESTQCKYLWKGNWWHWLPLGRGNWGRVVRELEKVWLCVSDHINVLPTLKMDLKFFKHLKPKALKWKLLKTEF